VRWTRGRESAKVRRAARAARAERAGRRRPPVRASLLQRPRPGFARVAASGRGGRTRPMPPSSSRSNSALCHQMRCWLPGGDSQARRGTGGGRLAARPLRRRARGSRLCRCVIAGGSVGDPRRPAHARPPTRAARHMRCGDGSRGVREAADARGECSAGGAARRDLGGLAPGGLAPDSYSSTCAASPAHARAWRRLERTKGDL